MVAGAVGPALLLPPTLITSVEGMMPIISWLPIADRQPGTLHKLPAASRRATVAWALCGLLIGVGGCQGSTDNTGPVGGAVSGALDTHCQGRAAQPTNQSSCHGTVDMTG